MCPTPLFWQRLLPVLLLAICLGFIQPASAMQVTDVLGRKVEVDHPPQRIVLGEGRLFFALALLDRDNPFQRVVGWQNDMRLLDPHTYEVYAQQYPQVAKSSPTWPFSASPVRARPSTARWPIYWKRPGCRCCSSTFACTRSAIPG